MGLPKTTIPLIEQVYNEVVSRRSYTLMQTDALLQEIATKTNLGVMTVISYQQQIADADRIADLVAAHPALSTFAETQMGAGYDLAAEWDVISDAIDVLNTWLHQNMPNDGVGGVNRRFITHRIDGRRFVAITAPTSSLGGLTTRLNALKTALEA